MSGTSELRDNASSPAWWSEGQNAGDTWGDGSFHEKFLICNVVGKISYLGYIPLYVSAFFCELLRQCSCLFVNVYCRSDRVSVFAEEEG